MPFLSFCFCVKEHRRFSHRQLQQFVEESVVLALEEGVGAARLGYSYPGQPGFLEVGREGGQIVRQGGQEVAGR